LEPATGVLSKTWMGLKQIIFLGGRKFLLSYCEFIERQSLKVYELALAENVLPDAAVIDIKKQIDEMKEAHQSMKSFRARSVQDLQVASV
jgi:hypothetical protein